MPNAVPQVCHPSNSVQSSPALYPLHHPFVQLLESSVEVIIDNDFLAFALSLAVFHFFFGLSQSLLDGILTCITSATQPLFQDLETRRLNEAYSGIQGAPPQLLDSFHLNVENAYPLSFGRCPLDSLASPLCDILDCHLRRAIIVSTEFCVFHKRILCDHLFKVFGSCKVVVHAILLTRTRVSRRVRDTEAEEVGMLCEKSFDQRGLASPRWAREDNRSRRVGRNWCWRHGKAPCEFPVFSWIF